jgi:hypothetical protein
MGKGEMIDHRKKGGNRCFRINSFPRPISMNLIVALCL